MTGSDHKGNRKRTIDHKTGLSPVEDIGREDLRTVPHHHLR